MTGNKAAIRWCAVYSRKSSEKILILIPSGGKAMNRQLPAEKIVAVKYMKSISWKQVADAMGRSRGFATAALLGQISLSKEEAQAAGQLLGLNEDEIAPLQRVPYRGSLPGAIPTDPLLYRFYEIMELR